MDKSFLANLKSETSWLRIFFIIVFILVGYLVWWIIAGIMLVQVFFNLFSGESNARLSSVTQSLIYYLKQILEFCCYHTNKKPYPFSDWPCAGANKQARYDQFNVNTSEDYPQQEVVITEPVEVSTPNKVSDEFIDKDFDTTDTTIQKNDQQLKDSDSSATVIDSKTTVSKNNKKDQ